MFGFLAAAGTNLAEATVAGDEFRDVLSGPGCVGFSSVFHELRSFEGRST